MPDSENDVRVKLTDAVLIHYNRLSDSVCIRSFTQLSLVCSEDVTDLQIELPTLRIRRNTVVKPTARKQFEIQKD